MLDAPASFFAPRVTSTGRDTRYTFRCHIASLPAAARGAATMSQDPASMFPSQPPIPPLPGAVPPPGPPTQPGAYRPYRPPAAWPKVIGIIAIVLASFGLVCGGCGLLARPLMTSFVQSTGADVAVASGDTTETNTRLQLCPYVF